MRGVAFFFPLLLLDVVTCSPQGSAAPQQHSRTLKYIVQGQTPAGGAAVAVPCTECFAGKYSSATAATDIFTCLECGSGKYSALLAATAAANCTDCARGKFSAAPVGASESVCVDCLPGTYSATAGAPDHTTCLQCARGKYSTATAAPAAANCTDCAPGKHSSTPAASTEELCVYCPAGTYTASPSGNIECEPCPIDMFSNASGASEVSTCARCSSTQVSSAAAAECTTCAAGKYKPPEEVQCSVCLIKHYCAGGVAIACDVNSHTDPQDRHDASAPRDCLCNAGYSHRPNSPDPIQPGPENVCHACTPGFYSESAGAVQCSPCGAGLYSPSNASLSAGNCQQCAPDSFSGAGERECTACPDNTQAPAGSGLLGDCICKPGFTGADGVMCSACPPGGYKTAAGSAECTNCAAGKFSTVVNASSDTCEPCPAHSNAPEGSAAESACTCNAGAKGTGGGPTCVLCVAGTYSESQGAAVCDNCASGNYSTVVGSNARANCTDCPTLSDSVPGSGAIAGCKCVPGSAGDEGGPVCTQCPAGQYQASGGAAQCDDCGAGAYWLRDDPGAKSSDVCLFCLGAYSSPVNKRCVCDIGHYTAELKFEGRLCDSVFAALFKFAGSHNAVAYYKDDESADIPASETWYVFKNMNAFAWQMGIGLDVGNKAFVIGVADEDHVDVPLRDWMLWCPTRATDWAVNITRVCAPCAAGKYGVSGGTGCTDCAPGKFLATEGSHSEVDCAPCPAGQYQAEAGSAACDSCGAGYYVLSDAPGAISSDVCLYCNGMHTSLDNGRCVCNAGYYSAELRFVGQRCGVAYDESFELSGNSLGVSSYEQAWSAMVQQHGGTQKIYKYTTDFDAFTWQMGGSPDQLGQAYTEGVSGEDDNDVRLRDWLQMCDAAYVPWPVDITRTCAPCAAGSYSGYGVGRCIDCPAGKASSSTAQGTDASCVECVEGKFSDAAGLAVCRDCETGTYQPEKGKQECLLCGTGKYLDVPASTSSEECILCPDRSGSSPAGSSEVTQCKCNSGSAGVDGGPTCALCLPGKYQVNIGEAECVDCAAGKKLASSGSLQENACTECDAGLVSSEGAAACRACDAHSQKVGEEALQDNCQCNIGFYRSGVVCTLCVAGRYKDKVGNDIGLCFMCPPASVYDNDVMCFPDYSNPDPGSGDNPNPDPGSGDGGTGGTGGTVPGPPIIIIPVGFLPFVECRFGICGCQKGYDGVPGDCTACAWGKYKTTIGSTPCTNCHDFSFSATTGAEDDAGCVCNAGYQQHADGATCAPCTTGQYKSDVGNQGCDSCPPGTSNGNTAQTVLSACVECQHGKFQSQAGSAACDSCGSDSHSDDLGAIDSSHCECVAGHTLSAAETCLACATGTYKSGPGNGACELCAAGKYNGNPMSALASACVLCEPGKYQPDQGSAECIACNAGKYGADSGGRDEGTSCLRCPDNEGTINAGSVGIASCVCNPGHTGNDEEGCNVCDAGTYKILTGPAACSPCPVDSGNNSPGSTTLESCKCNPGTTGLDGNACRACYAGQFKADAGDAACGVCVEGQYSFAKAIICETCPRHTQSQASSPTLESCTCVPGYTGADGTECTACAPGTHKPAAGAAQCTACVAGTYSAASGRSSTCDPCTDNSDSPASSTAVEQCACNAGATPSDAGASCALCQPGSYKVLTGAPACMECAAGKSTGGIDGRTTASQCVACVAGTYTALAAGNAACTACPADTASPQPGATSLGDCVLCNATQVAAANSSTCTTCHLGKFKSAVLATCVPCLVLHFCDGGAPVRCDANSQTSPAQRIDTVSGADCLCNAGYALRPFADYHSDTAQPSNECHACPLGHYNDVVGSAVCQACPSGGHVSANASTSISDCAECIVNTFSAAGAGECTPCADYSQAPPASGNVRDCLCNAGYTGLPGGPCASCDAGKYKIDEG